MFFKSHLEQKKRLLNNTPFTKFYKTNSELCKSVANKFNKLQYGINNYCFATFAKINNNNQLLQHFAK